MMRTRGLIYLAIVGFVGARRAGTKYRCDSEEGSGEVAEVCAPSKRRPSIALNATYRIRWLHVPKTGTSLANAIFRVGCPGLPAHAAMPRTQKNAVELYFEQCFKSVVSHERCYLRKPGTFGRAHVPIKEAWLPSTAAYVTVLREPRARLASAYAFGRHLCDFCNASTSLSEFAASPLNRAVYANMILGRWGFDAPPYPTRAELAQALDRLRGFAFVGILEAWTRTICLFKAKFAGGGRVLRSELANVRPGVYERDPRSGGQASEADRVDEAIYAEALRLFRDDYRAHFGDTGV